MENFSRCATCERPITPGADCICVADEPGYAVLPMAEVAALIMAAGIPVDWGHSGGNCATFYVGVPWIDGYGDRRHPVLCGVGYVGPDGQCFIATGGDCAVGFDDCDAAQGIEPEYVTGPDVTAQDLADVILRWFARWRALSSPCGWEGVTGEPCAETATEREHGTPLCAAHGVAHRLAETAEYSAMERQIAPDILAYWEGRTYAVAAGYSVPMAEDFAEWFSVWGRWDVAAEFDAYVPADS